MTLIELVNEQYNRRFTDAQEIPVKGSVYPHTQILKSCLDWHPEEPYYARILTVFTYKDRAFILHFHIWKPHQSRALANHMYAIYELKAVSIGDIETVATTDTDFGTKAFWQHTPDSQLDKEEKAVRAVGKTLKQYSVNNGLCRKFRKLYEKGGHNT